MLPFSKNLRMALAFVAFGVPAAQAGDIVYSPINPAFGGSPLNSSHLLATAAAQRNATASDAKKEEGSNPGGGTPTTGNSASEQFVRQLQSRLLSALASQVTDAIFGDNPQDQGTVRFGDTTVSFERTGDSIRLVIDDAGTTTEIIVPQLVTNPRASATSAAATAGTSSLPALSTLTSQSALSPLSIN